MVKYKQDKRYLSLSKSATGTLGSASSKSLRVLKNTGNVMIAEHLRIIKNITPLLAKNLKRGTFLCLFGTDKTPPHLGLVVEGKYYSTSAKESRVGENAELILRRVNQSTIPTLSIKLDIVGCLQSTVCTRLVAKVAFILLIL